MTTPRASKKQQELLQFVDGFIKGHGYSPSFREIMRALGYKSVSTVATHIDQLVAKGYVEKSDNSARSLNVVTLRESGAIDSPSDEKTIVKKYIERALKKLPIGTSAEDIRTMREAAALLDITLSDE